MVVAVVVEAIMPVVQAAQIGRLVGVVEVSAVYVGVVDGVVAVDVLVVFLELLVWSNCVWSGHRG